MTKIHSLESLLLEQLKDLYSAEKQLITALPKIARAVMSPDLKKALEDHLEQTKNQARRLEEAFKALDEKPEAVTCKAMKGLIEEGDEIIHKTDKDATRDAGIIGAAQRVEHYEIAAYGTAQSHASLLGHDIVAELLERTLIEEKEANAILNDIAEDSVNFQAKQMA